jgi:endo-1,4-beta-xylanase
LWRRRGANSTSQIKNIIHGVLHAIKAKPTAKEQYLELLMCLYELCKALLAQGVPLHGVGLQAHWDLDDLPSMSSVRKNIERFAALGLKVDITELDIRMKGAPTPERLRVQAEAYAALVRVVLDTEGSDSITVWGVDDGHSWVPQWMSSYGSALLLDGKYRAKQAYAAVVGELSNR